MRLRWLLFALSCGGCHGPSVARHEAAAVAAHPAAVAADVPLDSVDALAKAGYHVSAKPGGTITAAWRPVGGPVPVNELFEIELLLFDGRGEDGRLGPPLGGAKVQVSAWMPEHMHGMSRRPQTVESAPAPIEARTCSLNRVM